jgi:murein L,D-transpeptidase YcbB/YkuD
VPVPESVAELVPESVPESVPELVPESVPELVPELVPESVPEFNGLEGIGFAIYLDMRLHLGRSATLLVGALALAGCSRAAKPTEPDLSTALRTAVEAKAPAFIVDNDEREHHLWREEQRFYKQNGYQLVWSDGKRPRGQIEGLVRALRAAGEDGLEPADYHVDELDAARQAKLTPQLAIDLDLRATYAYLRFGWDLSRGTVDPEDVDPNWHPEPRTVDLHNALQSGLGEQNIGQSLHKLAPASPQYLGLKHQLAQHRTRGDAEAVHQIVMNMERWRWLPDDLGPRYLIVNIPAFELNAIENGKSVLDMKVVTGKKGSPTPVLVDRMTSIVFSPYWNIPTDIVDKEILPKIEKDPSYLEKNNMEVDENGRYRQRPGPGNSLGQVKFLFPNHYNVYLHDTPAQALFERVERDFSHGCVRLDRPEELAKYVLRDQPEWTDAKIAEAMQSGVERAVSLKQPLPIYLVYFTAWEENGALQRVPDVYGHDRRQTAAEASNGQ